MRSDQYEKLPSTLRWKPDASQAGHFLLTDASGRVWAKGIPGISAARVLSSTPGLFRGYKSLLEEAHECFRLRFRLRWNDPAFEDFLEDDGELEDAYPGAPALAAWLKEQEDRYDELQQPDGGSPVEPYVDPQVELNHPEIRGGYLV